MFRHWSLQSITSELIEKWRDLLAIMVRFRAVFPFQSVMHMLIFLKRLTYEKVRGVNDNVFFNELDKEYSESLQCLLLCPDEC